MSLFSFFKGRNLGTQAKINALNKGPLRQRVDVVKLVLDNGETGVGIKIVAKSLLSYQMLPVSLDKDQAMELANQIMKVLEQGKI